MFHTELCDRFGAEHPIMNAGMNDVAWGDMAGAVAAAGGIGVIGATGLSPERLREEIDRARDHAAGPLLVDVLFPLRAPEDRGDVPRPEYVPAPVETLRGELAEMGADVPDHDDLEGGLTQTHAGELLDVAIEADVDGLATAVGTPEWAVERAHDAGLEVVALCGRPRHAVYADEAGADVVVADGTEGGGHSGPVATLDLIPMIRRVTDIPVVAAGGITTGAQVLATLACGADGVWIGTRFIPTRESAADEGHVSRVLAADDAEATVRSELADGLALRMLRNRFTDVWEGHEDEIRDFPEQLVLNAPVRRAAEELGADEYKMYPGGQGAALIEDTDELPSVAEVMDDLVAGAGAAYDRLTGLRSG